MDLNVGLRVVLSVMNLLSSAVYFRRQPGTYECGCNERWRRKEEDDQRLCTVCVTKQSGHFANAGWPTTTGLFLARKLSLLLILET
jgi:hypothetical protein